MVTDNGGSHPSGTLQFPLLPLVEVVGARLEWAYLLWSVYLGGLWTPLLLHRDTDLSVSQAVSLGNGQASQRCRDTDEETEVSGRHAH